MSSFMLGFSLAVLLWCVAMIVIAQWNMNRYKRNIEKDNKDFLSELLAKFEEKKESEKLKRLLKISKCGHPVNKFKTVVVHDSRYSFCSTCYPEIEAAIGAHLSPKIYYEISR